MLASTAFVLVSGKRGVLVCERRSLLSLIGGGIAENTGIFLRLVALGRSEVRVVTPLAGTASLFMLLLSCIFLWGVQHLSWRIVVGAILIVRGGFSAEGDQPGTTLGHRRCDFAADALG